MASIECFGMYVHAREHRVQIVSLLHDHADKREYEQRFLFQVQNSPQHQQFGNQGLASGSRG